MCRRDEERGLEGSLVVHGDGTENISIIKRGQQCMTRTLSECRG